MTEPAPCKRCNDMGVVPLPGRDGFRVCPGWRYNPVPDPERDDCC
jgi:hypothetical protein